MGAYFNLVFQLSARGGSAFGGSYGCVFDYIFSVFKVSLSINLSVVLSFVILKYFSLSSRLPADLRWPKQTTVGIGRSPELVEGRRRELWVLK